MERLHRRINVLQRPRANQHACFLRCEPVANSWLLNLRVLRQFGERKPACGENLGCRNCRERTKDEK